MTNSQNKRKGWVKVTLAGKKSCWGTQRLQLCSTCPYQVVSRHFQFVQNHNSLIQKFLLA